jgi:plasmid stabilization system protein ParE
MDTQNKKTPKAYRFTPEHVAHIDEALRHLERARRACQSSKEMAEWANNIEAGADRPTNGKTADDMTSDLRHHANRGRIEAIEEARKGFAILRTIGPRSK